MTVTTREFPGLLARGTHARTPSGSERAATHRAAKRCTPIGTVTGMNDERKQGKP
jgi:hypothetical protein